MKHFVLFLTGARYTCAATFPSISAAEAHAKDWKLKSYAIGEVKNIVRFPKRARKLSIRKPARKLLAAPKS